MIVLAARLTHYLFSDWPKFRNQRLAETSDWPNFQNQRLERHQAADYTVIKSRTLEVTGNNVMQDCSV